MKQENVLRDALTLCTDFTPQSKHKTYEQGIMTGIIATIITEHGTDIYTAIKYIALHLQAMGQGLNLDRVPEAYVDMFKRACQKYNVVALHSDNL